MVGAMPGGCFHSHAIENLVADRIRSDPCFHCAMRGIHWTDFSHGRQGRTTDEQEPTAPDSMERIARRAASSWFFPAA
jgi:hypothetical protein